MNFEDKTHVQKMGWEPFGEQNHLQNLLRTKDQTYTSNDKTIQQHTLNPSGAFWKKTKENRTQTKRGVVYTTEFQQL